MRFSHRRHRRPQPHRRHRRLRLLAVTGVVAALALTAAACDSAEDGGAGDKAGSAASRTSDSDGDGIPDVLADRLREHGIDVGEWTGGAGAPYDYALLRVRPESGDGSLEETVGAALDVDFSAPSAAEAGAMGAWGYPAAPPYDGLAMFRCVDRPGRFSLDPSLPTMYRIGCTMTGGSSGGGWFRMVGTEPLLVSNTSIGPADGTWLAGPRLGDKAKALYDEMSSSYGGR
ncbi:hypothetical protein F9278_36640 [Streptomyces phaeolivaceus]|uniref:Lipoprotein n=1 Tax=Streptomyces phaeolivaceus TaxID=2653200 RepID=A0A5P8KBU1_9ACTN|nr:hypothetical protein [Streptomyces phaeolivaceus]QFR00804.1 hypothetical protein F9278_36640 [Streptomyces phaeolivaceus]